MNLRRHYIQEQLIKDYALLDRLDDKLRYETSLREQEKLKVEIQELEEIIRRRGVELQSLDDIKPKDIEAKFDKVKPDKKSGQSLEIRKEAGRAIKPIQAKKAEKGGKSPSTWLLKLLEIPRVVFPQQLRYSISRWWEYLLLFVLIVIIILFLWEPIRKMLFSERQYTVSSYHIKNPSQDNSQKLFDERSSLGEKWLVEENKSFGRIPKSVNDWESILNPTKKTSFSKFTYENNPEALFTYENNPEALIYLNNARLKKEQRTPLRIAVSVPITSEEDKNSVNIAQEILRGVAQAQEEINSSPKWKETLKIGLEVQILNDSNQTKYTTPLAQKLIKPDSKVLAVVGHNNGDASIAGANVYQGSLVMISPTSFDNRFKHYSEKSSYIFRTTPNAKSMAEVLVEKIKTDLNTNPNEVVKDIKLAICVNNEASDNEDFVKEVKLLLPNEIIHYNCSLQSDFKKQTDAQNIIFDIQKEEANALLIAPGINKLSPAGAIFTAAHSQKQSTNLRLFGSHTLYTQKVIDDTGKYSDSLILPGTWHPDQYPNSLLATNNNIWRRKNLKAPVNWRTAMAYDATRAIITALEQIKTEEGDAGKNSENQDLQQIRNKIQQALRSKDFSAKGSGEDVKFDPITGDRRLTPILLKVTCDDRSKCEFTYLPNK